MARKTVVDTITRLLVDWESPREPTYLREASLAIEMPERCTAEKLRGPLCFSDPIPDDLREFWTTYSSARLFEDVNYGQWGLILLDYDTSVKRTGEFFLERPKDALPGDRVIGQFIGDQDLLVTRCIPGESDFGSILVALRDGWRKEWYHRVAEDLSSFLEEYASYEGQKFWETKFEGRRTGSSVRGERNTG
jgi:hypothetical protein